MFMSTNFAFPLSMHKFSYVKINITEQGSNRPTIILQNDLGNKFSPTVIVAAITSQVDKSPLPTHVSLQCKQLAKDSVVLLEQVRTVDKIRLGKYIGRLDQYHMEKINKALAISLGLNNESNKFL